VLGRIAAQTAKQVILQKVREAERDTIYNEFHTRVGELVNSIVKRMEGPDIIVDLGRTEARLPKREQSRLETYNVGDRLRVTIRAVERAAKGPQVVVSRADPPWCSACSKWKCRKFTTARCRFAPWLARPANAPRSPWRAATRTWTRWARAWA
jgi:hypothetical protein